MADVHYTFDVPKGRERFRELIVYVSAKCQSDPHFGSIKLNKILFYSDFRAFERLGEALTGVAYFALPEGPAPYLLLPVRRQLEQEKAIRVEDVPVGNYVQKRTVALREPDTALFSKGELAIVDEVIAELWNKSAKMVSEESHGVAWRTRALESYIPYEAVFYSDDPPSSHDIVEARKLNDRYEWGLRV